MECSVLNENDLPQAHIFKLLFPSWCNCLVCIRRCGGVMEDNWHWWQALRLQMTCMIPSQPSLCHNQRSRCKLSSALLFGHHGLQLSETINQISALFYKLIFVMVFDHSNGKVAKAQLHPRHRENSGRRSKCLKVPKDQQEVCCEIVFYMKGSSLHQSYQYGCLNKACTMTIPADIPVQVGKCHKAATLVKELQTIYVVGYNYTSFYIHMKVFKNIFLKKT